MAPTPAHNVVKPAVRTRVREYGYRAAILVLPALLLGLGLWLRSPALPPDRLAWTLPLPLGGAVTVLLWTHDLALSAAYTTGGLTRQTPGPLRLTLEVQRTTAGPYQRLAVLPVPTWPLLIPAALLALAALRI